MFLDPRTFSTAKVSMDHFREWAGEITNSYLNAGALPTETLCKIAQSESLTPAQVSILAAEANKMIHNHKYANMDEKYFAADFPLADAQTAIQRLQLDGGETKVAAEMPAPKFSEQGPDAYDLWGVKPETIDKTASVKHHLKTASVRGELVSQKLQDQIILSKYAAENAEQQFIKTARQMVIDQPSSADRLKTLGMLDHFVKQAGMPVGRKALAKLAYVLMKEGKLEPGQAKQAVDYFLSKEADQKAPAELISENLPAKVVNGQHPLYISLKTLQECNAELRKTQERYSLVDDKLDLVRQKIRAL